MAPRRTGDAGVTAIPMGTAVNVNTVQNPSTGTVDLVCRACRLFGWCGWGWRHVWGWTGGGGVCGGRRGGAHVGQLRARRDPNSCCSRVVWRQIVSTNNSTIIKNVVVYDHDGGVLDSESLMVYPNTPSNTVRVPLVVKKNTPAELLIQVRAERMSHVLSLGARCRQA